MKKLWLLLLMPALVWVACNDEPAGENGEIGSVKMPEQAPPPPRPTVDIRLIDNYVDSLRSAQGLETLEKINDLDPSVFTTYKGYFVNDNNYYVTEQNKTARNNQLSTFAFKDGEMVFSNHKMLTERCGHYEDICMTETRQYFKDQKVIWSESRYQKVTIGKAKGEIGLEFFSLMDTVGFRVIPNLRESGTLYEKDINMSDRTLEELRQPEELEQNIIILE